MKNWKVKVTNTDWAESCILRNEFKTKKEAEAYVEKWNNKSMQTDRQMFYQVVEDTK